MWFCGMNLFYIWSLTFNRMHGSENHLAVVSNTCLCLHMSNGKDDIWGKPTLICVHWNFLMGLHISFLRMTCKSYILQWFISSFTAKTDPSIRMLHLKKTGHSLCPCLTLWIWITASVLGLKDRQPTNYKNRDDVSSRGSLALTQQGSPACLLLFGSSNQIACRCVVCVCQQHE